MSSYFNFAYPQRGHTNTTPDALHQPLRLRLTGINFLAFCRIKRYCHLRPTEHNCFSERVIGSGPPFEKSCKPVVATSGSGFFTERCLRGLSWDRFLGRHNRRLYPAGIVRAAIRCTIAGHALELFTCAPSIKYGAPSTNKP